MIGPPEAYDPREREEDHRNEDPFKGWAPEMRRRWCRERARVEQEVEAVWAVTMWFRVLRLEAEGLRLVGWVAGCPRLAIADPVRAHRFGWRR